MSQRFPYKDDSTFCCYCGKRFSFIIRLTADHLIPVSKGGTNNFINKRNCCANCNTLKGSLYPEQFLKLLQRERTLFKRKNLSVYDIDIMIENTEYIIQYVQTAGYKLFVNDHFYENYVDRRNVKEVGAFYSNKSKRGHIMSYPSL